MRTPLIAGNWKMNMSIKESKEFAAKIKEISLDNSVEQLICPPYTIIASLKDALKGTNIKVGSQNINQNDSGAYTGEISATMLKEIGATHVIIGHSERRQYYNETDETVNEKIKKSLQENIIPIMCVGESLEQRESGQEKEVVKSQVIKGLKEINDEKVVIAYEPIWAIGTGKTATTEQANDMIKYIRYVVKEEKGDIADKIRILYGGSVKPSNIKELMATSDIDGALVGGAGLKVDDYAALVNYQAL